MLIASEVIAGTPSGAYKNSMTGNAGLHYVAWQLSRRGWHAMPTIRNARGSDLIVTDAEETKFFGVQSKALGKRHAVPLGLSLEKLRSQWWVVTVLANDDRPECFVMKLGEVKALSSQDANGGAYWLSVKAYCKEEFRDAWHRLANSD